MSQGPTPSSSRRILIVDDHIDTGMAMQRLLQGMGYQARSADSFASAVKAAEEGPVDLLLTDIQLLDGNGMDLLREIKSRGSPGAKGITLSGYTEDEEKARSRNAGYAAHMAKPVDFQQLLKMVKNLLE